MRFLVDGYNVTMADDATRRLPKAEQRDALVRRIATRGRELLGNGEVTIVFDGDVDVAARESHRAVDVRFAKGETADDVIVRLAAAEPGKVLLVSSDRLLRDRVLSVAAGRAEFVGASHLFEERRPSRKRKGVPRDAGLPRGANKVTEELKKLWLHNEEDE
jgi:predicted RNA-binding protein with PIN domain